MKRINWLNVNDRFNQCISVSAFKFFNKECPLYMSDIFKPAGENGMSTRNGFQKLSQPFRKTNQSQKALSYIGPSVWNKLPEQIKKTINLNTFKHSVKRFYFKELK